MPFSIPDVREGTVIVIRKDGKYLSRRGTMTTGEVTWDPNLSNAWMTRIKNNAIAVAQKFGGEPVFYNSRWEDGRIEIRRRTMTEKEYNSAEGIRRSDLWKMDDSAEKFKWFLEHPVEQTPAMAFGSACHKMILEPGTFGDEYAIAPAVDRRTKVGKEQWEAFCADNAGKTIISQDDADVMAEMEAALHAHPLADALINGEGQPEVSVFWKDPDTGETCKAKLDRVIKDEDGRYVIVDYKTTTCAETDRFNHEIFKLGYHFQAGFYTEGLMIALGLDYRPKFLLVPQEKKAPYAVNVIEVTDDVMKLGVAKFHELLERYHECAMLDVWPGYCTDVPNETQLPGWVSLDGEEE